MAANDETAPASAIRDRPSKRHPASTSRDPGQVGSPRMRPTQRRRGYGWLMIMLLIGAMFGTPVVIAALILLRGA